MLLVVLGIFLTGFTERLLGQTHFTSASKTFRSKGRAQKNLRKILFLDDLKLDINVKFSMTEKCCR